MANQSKTVKFEVGQFVLFPSRRIGRVSRIAKNGAIYVIVLGETTVEDQTREELRVKKADLQHVSAMMALDSAHTTEFEYVSHMIRAAISRKVTARAKMTEAGVYGLAPDYIPSPGCLEYCEWGGSEADKSVMHNFGIDLVKLANLYTGKREVPNDAPQSLAEMQVIEEPANELSEAFVNAAQEIVAEMQVSALPAEPVQATLALESTEPKGEPKELAKAKHALRELTFSVTRHSILTAFIDVALNKDIPGYHHQVASNLKNLMAAAFDPVHDAGGYARINTWTMAALELVVKNKDRVAKMLSQPIEAAPIKMDRVTKLGMWIDNMMNNKGPRVNDMTSADDSCYVYDAMEKKLETCTFVVVEVIQAMGSDKVEVLPLVSGPVCYPEYLTAQSAIKARSQFIRYYRPIDPILPTYTGIVPIYETEGTIKEAVEKELASVINGLK